MKYQVEFSGVRLSPKTQIYPTKLDAKKAIEDFVAQQAQEGFQVGVDYPVWSDFRQVSDHPRRWIRRGTIYLYSGWAASIIVTEISDELESGANV